MTNRFSLKLTLVVVLVLGRPAWAGHTIEANRVVQISLVSAKAYPDPANNLQLEVVVLPPEGVPLRVPAFWAGGNRWRFRYASGQVGRHTWRTACTDVTNRKLHGVDGVIEVVRYRGVNPLYRHGPIRVAADQRHFEHADGTPFFWLGDTWWKGLCDRIPWAGFQQLTADRAAKGFTAVQIVTGPYPDETLFDARWANEGGLPYASDFARVNPRYFEFADRRIEHLVEAGIVPVIVGSWGMHLPAIGVEKMQRHWRYLIARYGAYPVIWIIAGEAGDADRWAEVTREVRRVDPFRRLVTVHPPLNSARKHMAEKAVLDFDMISTGHGGWDVATRTVSELAASYALTPPMPVLVGEVCYEGHMLTHWQDYQRYLFWSLLLNGAAGHTYGAGGIWQMNSATVRGSEYEDTPWFEAMGFPGSYQLGLAKKLLAQYPWWRFRPHPEWVAPRGYAAGVPGEVRLVYVPYRAYDWSPPTIKGLEPNVAYRASYWDPASGKRYDLGPLARPAVSSKLFSDDFSSADASDWQDHGTASRREDGGLVGGKGLLAVLGSIDDRDVQVGAEASSDAEAGLVVRFQHADDYLVGLYSPLLKAVYLHDRQGGEWGPELGRVPVPEIGPNIRLTVAACGNGAVASLTDGVRSYVTPTVRVRHATRGKVGVWCFQVGDRQRFDNFELSRLQPPPRLTAPIGRPPVLKANPYVGLPAVEIPEISWLLTDAYVPPRLPAPQDWILLLERGESPPPRAHAQRP